MSYSAINLKEKFTKFREQWSPKVIGQLNEYQFKIAKVEGEFVWHSHAETDEAFIVLEGQLKILFRDGEVVLNPGEMYVVQRGVEHKPVADRECHILMVEPEGTTNTGDAGGEMTREVEWV